MSDVLQELLAGQAVWRCRESADGLTAGAGTTPTVTTGYSVLDSYLPGGGWPLDSLMEVIVSESGIGELRLLMPALTELAANRDGHIVWVAPPYMPYAPALAQWGLDVARVLLIHSSQVDDVLWATGEALASGSALAVLSWMPEMDVAETRRLQLAASSAKSWAIAFRSDSSARHQSSAATLRLALQAGSKGTEIDFFKIRGARPRRISGYDEYRGHWPQLDGRPFAHQSSVPG